MLDTSQTAPMSASHLFALTDDHRAIRDMAREFAAEKLTPHAIAWDERKHFPVDVMREAAALGMGGVYVREDVGGSGFTSSHFGFLGCGGVGWLGWGRLRRCSAGRARWRSSEGQGFQELGPGGEHNIGAQGLQVVEEAGSGSKRLAGVPPSA